MGGMRKRAGIGWDPAAGRIYDLIVSARRPKKDVRKAARGVVVVIAVKLFPP